MILQLKTRVVALFVLGFLFLGCNSPKELIEVSDLINEKKYDEALSVMDYVLESRPDHEDFIYLKAYALQLKAESLHPEKRKPVYAQFKNHTQLADSMYKKRGSKKSAARLLELYNSAYQNELNKAIELKKTDSLALVGRSTLAENAAFLYPDSTTAWLVQFEAQSALGNQRKAFQAIHSVPEDQIPLPLALNISLGAAAIDSNVVALKFLNKVYQDSISLLLTDNAFYPVYKLYQSEGELGRAEDVLNRGLKSKKSPIPHLIILERLQPVLLKALSDSIQSMDAVRFWEKYGDPSYETRYDTISTDTTLNRLLLLVEHYTRSAITLDKDIMRSQSYTGKYYDRIASEFYNIAAKHNLDKEGEIYQNAMIYFKKAVPYLRITAPSVRQDRSYWVRLKQIAELTNNKEDLMEINDILKGN